MNSNIFIITPDRKENDYGFCYIDDNRLKLISEEDRSLIVIHLSNIKMIYVDKYKKEYTDNKTWEFLCIRIKKYKTFYYIKFDSIEMLIKTVDILKNKLDELGYTKIIYKTDLKYLFPGLF